MARVTDDKNEKMHFQTDRFVLQNGEWYYLTREGGERGPFESKEDARGDMMLYILHQLKMQQYGQ